MLSTFKDVVPPPVLAAGLVWAGISYFGTGPEIAARVARFDYLPACEANIRSFAAQAGEHRLRSLTLPSGDPMQEMAAAQVRRLQNNPFMQQLRGLGGGMGDLFGMDAAANAALQQMENAKRSAREAYERAAERIRQETATTLAKAGDMCGCLADAAIADTRSEWAIYAGTLTVVQPAPVKSFGARMAQMHQAGGCAPAGKAGS